MNLMRTTRRLLSPAMLVLDLSGLVACAPAPGDSESTTATELAALPSRCDGLLEGGANLLAVGAVQDQSGRYVVETSAGRCTSSRADLISAVRRRDEHGMVSALSGKLRPIGNPTPHPDVGIHSTEPNPHPDVSHPDSGSTAPTGPSGGDPDPHPDLSMDAEDDDDVVIIWIIIVQDEDSSSSDGTPTHADDSGDGLANGGH